MEDFGLPHLEWEILREPVTISKVDHVKELPEGQKRIEINRDESYRLRGTLYFKGDYKLFLKKIHQASLVPAGSFAKTFEIQGSDQDEFRRYTLKSCLIAGGRISQKKVENRETLCESDLDFQSLRIRRYKTEAEGTRLTEWYINGPRDDVFCRVTDRKVIRSFFRERSASKDKKIDSIKVSRESVSFGVDFLRIKARDFQFLVTKVPKGIGPSWSSNIGIEYQRDWGRIPNIDEREKIEELCSFVFGRQLLSVGYTKYDQNGSIVEACARNPWIHFPRALCSEPDWPPIGISKHPRGKAEDVVTQLLPAYYKMRKPLCLKEALWQYWIARNIPIGTNLTILSSAVETIMNGWFKSRKSKSHGVYMKKKEFESLLKEEIGAIKRKLENKTDGDKIIAKILKAYNFGIKERYRVFFDEIPLSIDEHEWEAIEERHRFAHGRIKFDNIEWKLVTQYAQTYETLLHKILLKLLGYYGTYVDRSAVGWKDRQLS